MFINNQRRIHSLSEKLRLLSCLCPKDESPPNMRSLRGICKLIICLQLVKFDPTDDDSFPYPILSFPYPTMLIYSIYSILNFVTPLSNKFVRTNR